MKAGCLTFGIGLLLTTIVISPHPDASLLAISLSIVGIGIGLTVVPITDAALAAVPSDRSGMAASATNTSRELGAVVGVAVLGAVVSSRLTSDLSASLHRIGVPKLFQQLIINAIERSGTSNYDKIVSGHNRIAAEVVVAAHKAFGSGLYAALISSAVLVLATGLLVALTSRTKQT
jgi:hypothetical protein